LKKQKAFQEFDWRPPEALPVTLKFLQKAIGYDRNLSEPRREEIFNNLYDMLPPLPSPKYIIRDYEPSTYHSEFIKDEDVARPSNHKYTTVNDRFFPGKNHWLYSSMATHQTYGTCDRCFVGGPVMAQCQNCWRDNHHQRFEVFMLGDVELDSVTLAKSLGRRLVPQRADREFDWNPPGARCVTVQFLQTAVGFNRNLSEPEREVIFNNVYEMLPPDPRVSSLVLGETEGSGNEQERKE
jgi:hypothetical protein